jgi:hypothetical protein
VQTLVHEAVGNVLPDFDGANVVLSLLSASALELMLLSPLMLVLLPQNQIPTQQMSLTFKKCNKL